MAVKGGPKQAMGYECEFAEPPPRHLQSECSICLLILREPHIVSCCGYSYCAACIGRVKKDGKPCPLCSVTDFTTMANKGLRRSLHEFRVHCPHRLHGCGWIGELGKLDEHLNCEPQPERQLEGCQFAEVECLYCKKVTRRDKVSDHQLKQCPQRPHTCECCAEYKSTFEDVTLNHWAECKCYLLPCPNNCTASGPGIQRQHFDHHVNKECPLTVVQCELHHAGCKVSLPRKDMADHMREDAIAHISLLAAENLKLRKQLLEKEEWNRKLEEKSAELSKELDRLSAQQSCLQTQQQHDMRELRLYVELRSNIVPVTFKMAGFKELKQADSRWYSRPFYTSRKGYNMCLKVHADGYKEGRGTHISVYTCLLRGEFDFQLRWPFRGTVIIELVNQLEDKEHYTYANSYTDITPNDRAARLTAREQAVGWGKRQFIANSELGFNRVKNCQYLKNDYLIFRILSVEL